MQIVHVEGPRKCIISVLKNPGIWSFQPGKSSKIVLKCVYCTSLNTAELVLCVYSWQVVSRDAACRRPRSS